MIVFILTGLERTNRWLGQGFKVIIWRGEEGKAKKGGPFL